MILREANINDCKLYFDWVNDKAVRQNAFHMGMIDWERHQEWFKDKINDSNSYLYVAENNQGKIGQARFDCVDGKAVIDYSISSNFRGKGLGKKVAQQAIKKIKKNCLNIEVIEAKVKVSNIASNKIFLGLDFNEHNRTKQVTIYRLVLDKI